MYSAYFPSMPNYAYGSMALPMMGLMTGVNPFNQFGIQTQFCNDATFIDTRIQQCCNTVSADDLMMRMEAQCNAVDYLQKRINEADALHNVGVMTTKEVRDDILDKQTDGLYEDALKTMNSYGISMEEAQRNICQYFGGTLYADNKPIASEAPKKRYTIYDLDRFIFPEDPIRDWVERKVTEINKKYSWVDQLDI